MANKYWNGTGTWSTAANWFLDDLHLSGTTVPSTGGTDNVFFTANSTGTCTVSTSAFCLNLDMTGFAGSFAGTSSLSIYGGMKFSGGTFTFSGNIDTLALTGLYEIWTNGKTLGTITFRGNNSSVGANYIFMDNCTLGSGKLLMFNVGGLNLNGKTIIAPSGFK